MSELANTAVQTKQEEPAKHEEAETTGIERLFVSVGTDYHRFDRLIWWLDEWLAGKPSVSSVVIQRGTSAIPEHAESIEYLQRTQLIEEFNNASVVVCHGGPATIMESRKNGIVPIVVPREERFDEHVNDHQVDFCERLAAHGDIQLARKKDEFFRLLDLAVERGAPELAFDDGHAATSVQNFESTINELLGRPGVAKLQNVENQDAVEPAKVPVLFIGSIPRSGSTIISDLLNENPHMVNIGELVHLWERGVVDNNLCGCGEAFDECEFWSAVGEEAFGGWHKISGERMRTLQLRSDRTRHIPSLMLAGKSRFFATSTAQYGSVVSRVLRAALKVSGKPMIVDTSKHVSTALLLRQQPDIDLRVLHVVRDPRGVANSWSKIVPRPEANGEADMAQLHPGRVGMRWLWFNWAFANMDRLGVPTTTVRYEDFVANPVQMLDQIFSFVGLEASAAELLEGEEPLVLEPGHSVSGNPRRLERKPVEFKADEQWRTDLDPKFASLVGAITRPMLARYHYNEEG